MKFAIVGLMALSLVSAQNATSDVASSVVVATTTTITPTSTTTSNCAVQSVFDLCLSNQDDYVKRCQPQDYACLCTTNKQKLSCWVNCPNDSGKGTQEGIVQEACSMPGANVSVTPWSSSAAPTSTNIVASSSIPASSSIAPATPTKAASGSSALDIGNTAFALIGAAIVYMIF